MRTVLILILAAAVAGCRTPQKDDSTMTLSEFQKQARAFDSVISLPKFETKPEQIIATVRTTIREGNAALDKIAALNSNSANFRNTVVALDDLGFDISQNISRIYLIKETSTNVAMRAAATAAVKDIEEWSVGLDYREDVYRVLKAFADTQPSLEGEDAKLLKETLRDYKRAGLELPKPERDEVERMRRELSRLETDFQSNVTRAEKDIEFTKAELAGVPEAFLEQIKAGNDRFTVKVNVTWHYITIMDNASNEAVRKKIYHAHSNLARAQNVELLERILVLRDTIAKKLGYDNWAEYKTEVKMVQSGAAAIEFLEQLETGLQPKFDSEMEILRQMKTNETSDVTAAIKIWDWRYYSNQLKKQKYAVDKEQLRVYFPYQRVLIGMFNIYQHIFGLKFQLVEPPYKWIGDLQLYAVSDAQTGEPLGLFYLDMFPREGKYNHFAQFGLIDGKRLPNGKYKRPAVALICNFPAPTRDKPALLSHDDVETIFHEFGHAMHSILTRANYARFSCTSVPRDFVEAPSQMLENWVWDKTVLDSFAADYRDPSKKIPQETLSKLKESRLATEGLRYRRQLSFGLLDLTLHTQINAKNASEALPLSNLVLSEVFMPVGDDTAFVAYFGHLMGYDAGYYGYAWADAISADMATVFEKAPGGYFDLDAGMKLRKEIYEPGDSRDVNISIEEFLGRPRSNKPFLKQIGIGN